jgi:shikimate kinase
MGCGKTHYGKELAQKLQVPFFDLDEKIEEQEERKISEIFENEGEEYFRLLEKDVLHMITESHETFVMACGGGTPCFYNTIDYMNKKGTTVWINCSIDCLHERLLKVRSERPLLNKISDDQLRSYIVKKFGGRKIFYQQANVILNEDDLTIDKLVDHVFHP